MNQSFKTIDKIQLKTKNKKNIEKITKKKFKIEQNNQFK